MLVAQSCPTLCNPMDCSLISSSVRGIEHYKFSLSPMSSSVQKSCKKYTVNTTAYNQHFTDTTLSQHNLSIHPSSLPWSIQDAVLFFMHFKVSCRYCELSNCFSMRSLSSLFLFVFSNLLRKKAKIFEKVRHGSSRATI